jgi:excisionase family DNA binding protein
MSSLQREHFPNDEAAAYIGVQPNTLATWRSTHRYNIPFIRVGSRIFYRKADLDEWLAARRVTQ